MHLGMIIEWHISMRGHALLLQVSIGCLAVLEQAGAVLPRRAGGIRMVGLNDP